MADEVDLLRSANEQITGEAAAMAKALVDVIVTCDEPDVLKRTLSCVLASPLAREQLQAGRLELEP